MDMIKCPECGKEIPKNMESCPECGYVFDETDEQRKNLLKKWTKPFVIVIIICIFMGLGTLYRSNAVPKVTKMELTKAIKILKEHEIPYTTYYDYSENCDKGIVFAQSIKANTIYKKGEKIELGVSSGRNYIMPDVAGKNIQEINDQIKDMPIEIVYKYTNDVEKDMVVKSTLEAGEVFNETSKPQIIVSRGIFQDVPNVDGMSVEEAKNVLDNGGFKYRVKEEYWNKDPGVVYEHSPERYGDKDKTTIVVYVSKGPGIAVPSVEHNSINEAIQKLTDEGFGYKIVRAYSDLTTSGEDTEIDTVTEQNISGRVDEPCEVTLTVNNPAIKITNVSFESNYVGGIDTYINFQNISDKQIAYVMFNMKYYDRMGNPARCQIRNTSSMNLQYTGPLNAGTSSGKQYWDAVIYDSSVAAVMPKSATITFSDNTKQTITYTGSYWYSNEYYGGSLHD